MGSLNGLSTGWHSLPLGNEKHLVCIDWKNGIAEFHWSSRPDVIPLPHPIFEATVPLSDEHRTHLSRRYTLNPGDNVHHVIKQAAKEDLWMRLWVL